MTDQPTQNEPMVDEPTLAAVWRSGGDARVALPTGLRAKLIEDARLHLLAPKSLPIGAATSPSPWLAWSGWIAAAAAVVVLLVFFATRPQPEVAGIPDQPAIELVEPLGFEALLAACELEPVKLDVLAMDDDFDQAEAEVAWDNEQQIGVLRVRNLPANDVVEAQYQLWIVDATRPDDNGRNRVDGGVFDVAPETLNVDGWSEIQIDSKLPVGDAVGFAITLEPPGGSVVSELGPRLLMITG
ncbi:MAG: anti-sigma factor [Planctomycetota bacterium]